MARESELTDRLQTAIHRYPRTCAVAVRNHGIYVWGPTASKAKTHAECLHYLCGLKCACRSWEFEYALHPKHRCPLYCQHPCQRISSTDGRQHPAARDPRDPMMPMRYLLDTGTCHPVGLKSSVALLTALRGLVGG